MKRISITICTLCLMLLSFGLTACGSTVAKITGLCAGVGTEQINPLVYGNPLWNDETLTNDDYTLQVGQNYLLGVAYAQYGGSIIRDMNIENIALKYDAEVLEITPPEEKEGFTVYYNLTCKKAVVNTAIIVEVDGEYTCTVIISAE